MKTYKIFLASVLLLFGLNNVNAQTATIRIQTSAICEKCKDRIENDLSFAKGVKSAVLDQKTKIVTVVYNSNKTDPQKIREAISKSGYDADSLKADAKSYQKLPACCRKEEKAN